MLATRFLVLPSLGEVARGEYLVGAPVANLVLGLVRARHPYKARCRPIGPVSVRTGMLSAGPFLPVAAAIQNGEARLTGSLVAPGVVFGVAAPVVRKPRLPAHLGRRPAL